MSLHVGSHYSRAVVVAVCVLSWLVCVLGGRRYVLMEMKRWLSCVSAA